MPASVLDIPIEAADDSLRQANMKLLKTALQEKVFYNPLKRYLYKEELRLQKLLDSILEAMPPALLTMKIGDLIDVCRGLKVTSEPDHSTDNAPFSDANRLDTALELLCWIRKFLPTPEEQESMPCESIKEEVQASNIYEDTYESVPPPKRARLDEALNSVEGAQMDQAKVVNRAKGQSDTNMDDLIL